MLEININSKIENTNELKETIRLGFQKIDIVSCSSSGEIKKSESKTSFLISRFFVCNCPTFEKAKRNKKEQL